MICLLEVAREPTGTMMQHRAKIAMTRFAFVVTRNPIEEASSSQPSLKDLFA
jgi:hypothetical protein